MSDWHHFDGVIEPMQWGENHYTVLPLPNDIAEALKSQGARRVDAELNDYPLNVALTTAPVLDRVFVYTGKAVLKAAGLTPGEVIDVRMRAADPNDVDVPEDVLAALRAAGKTTLWEALTPGKQRGLLHQVQTAKRADTRVRRINTLLTSLDQP